jgi:hypothetical protein
MTTAHLLTTTASLLTTTEDKMNTSESIDQIAGALSAARGEMTGAKKDASNPFFKSSYADLASVMEAIAGPFAAHDLAYFQSVYTTDTGMIGVITRIMHKSGQWIESDPLLLPPVKNDPQAFGSAVTYGKRYSLQAACGVPSVDDDGNHATQNVAPKKRINRELKQKYLAAMIDALEREDGLELKELGNELKEQDEMLSAVWAELSTKQKTKIKELQFALKGEDT